ncbi:MAG: hypothetical protein FWG94_04220 [Oscillospiraceae bacterium]|nr:hypothetical protein [Oscillospiraceae bacterium]
MFVVLEVATENRGGFMGRIFKSAPHAETRAAFGARYGAIVSRPPLKQSDWERILALAGRYADRLLLPANITPPQAITKPRFLQYDNTVILKTAVEIIKLSRMPMYRRTVGLVDLKGGYSGFLYPLLHHYTSVKVLTGNSALYENESAKMMYELGAPVSLAEDYTAFSDCVLILAPDGIETSESLKCPVLSRKPPSRQQFSDFITDLKVVPPAGFASQDFPEGIDKHDFLAALYEYCGVLDVCFPACRMIFKYRECEVLEVVSAINKISGFIA